MPGHTFGSDNHAPAHPDVLAALARINHGHALPYGADGETEVGGYRCPHAVAMACTQAPDQTRWHAPQPQLRLCPAPAPSLGAEGVAGEITERLQSTPSAPDEPFWLDLPG